MTARLPAGLEVSALLRAIDASGDSAMVLHRGDPDRGAILMVVLQRGSYHGCFERRLADGGDYRWMRCGPADDDRLMLADDLSKRLRFDPDHWQIELNVADAERFIAETIAEG